MNKSAYDIAVKVLQPEYEGKVKPEVLKKIQTTVRRKDTSEVEEEKKPCTSCGVDLPISELYCGSCKSNLPYDSFTGMHMLRDDFCVCPNCNFPCSYSSMLQAHVCPMCNADVPNPELIINVDDALKNL